MRDPWCVAVTRDEPADGPLSTALRRAGFTVFRCPVVTEQPPSDPAPLSEAAANLDTYRWAIFSSRRGVDAVGRARNGAWPAHLRTAAVGASTAKALRDAGVAHEPIVTNESGADALWQALQPRDWRGVRVLIPTVADGRRTVIDGLKNAGADVTVVEAYQMRPRAQSEIAAEWSTTNPDVVVIASPSAARSLISAIGRDACASLAALFAIGPTTADAIRTFDLEPLVSPTADFEALAEFIANTQRRASGRITHADG